MTAAPVVGGGAAPAPTNGATSATTQPAPSTDSAPKPPAAGETAQAKPEAPWKAKRKLTIGGKEREIEYDDRRLQILEHTLSQKAEFEKQQNEFQARMRKLQEDPDGFLDEAGFDFESYAARRAQRLEQMKALSPEQRKIQTLEEQLAKRQAEDQKRAEQEAQAAQEAEDRAFQEGNVKLYGETMRMAGLQPGKPGAASFLSNMATVRMMAHNNGEPDLTADQLLVHTERYENNLFKDMLSRKVADEGWRGRNGDGMQALAKAVLSTLDGEALIGWVGKDMATRIVKALHAKTRTSPVPIIQEPSPVAPAGQTQPSGAPRTEWDILDALGG